MIDKKTVFILGAGASAPYGFPTGLELRKKIINQCTHRIGELTREYPNTEEYIELASQFSMKFKNANVNSIDRFLNEQETRYINLGKILIMAFIRDCEKHSNFAEDIKNPEHDWYRLFFNQLIRGVKKFDELSFDNFSILTFNYDRSFEYFLYLSIRNLYPISKVSDEMIMKLMRSLKIQHIFGRVENMIWDAEGTFDEANVYRYYCELHYDNSVLRDKINNIKVISEVKAETFNYKEIIENAEEVYFLGFGYLEENMEILGAPFYKKSSSKTCFRGTAMGFSKEVIERVLNRYFLNGNSNNTIIDCDCCTLLRNYLE